MKRYNEEHKDELNRYRRDYYKKNREKIREQRKDYDRRYWETHKVELSDYYKDYREKRRSDSIDKIFLMYNEFLDELE